MATPTLFGSNPTTGSPDAGDELLSSSGTAMKVATAVRLRVEELEISSHVVKIR